MSSQEITQLSDGAGITTVIGSVFLFIIDKLDAASINQWLILTTSFGGLIWLIFKIKGQYLDNKLKQKQLNKNK
jgi:hypothetical protein